MRYHRSCFWFLASLMAAIGFDGVTCANDYVLTIGGGYEPAGNQASLEANVLFFQQVVKERFSSTAQNHVYFADGVDAQEDLQVMLPKPAAASPAIALLESVFALDKPKLIYRNHEVPNVRGR